MTEVSGIEYCATHGGIMAEGTDYQGCEYPERESDEPCRGVPLYWDSRERGGTDMRVREQKPHTLRVAWTSQFGEMHEEWSIDCPYPADHYDKPCRIWASEDDHTGESEPGCWVRQSLENGIECVDVAVPSSSVAPWSVCVTGSGVEWPRLTDVSFCSCTPENVEEP